MSMNILAHDLPIDEKKEFYEEKSKKELADYTIIGAEDREKSYFLKMFLSCYRACEYLTQRPGHDAEHGPAVELESAVAE